MLRDRDGSIDLRFVGGRILAFAAIALVAAALGAALALAGAG